MATVMYRQAMMFGRLVLNPKLETPMTKLSLEGFPAGIYLLTAASEDRVFVKKIVLTN